MHGFVRTAGNRRTDEVTLTTALTSQFLMKSTFFRRPIIPRIVKLLALTFVGRSLGVASAQNLRLSIGLEYPSALSSVGSVLATPNGNIVVNHDGFGGYGDGAIFVLDSNGQLLRRISATQVQALLDYPFFLEPTARASLADGSLIVDYSSWLLGTTDPFFRLRLDPEGIAVSPGNDGGLPLGPLAVQETGGLVIAPSSKEWSVPLVRFAQETQGPRRGFLSIDHKFFNQVLQSSDGQRCLGLATGASDKIWAWLADTNSTARLARFLPDGRLDPGFNHSTAPRVRLTDLWDPWIGPLPDGRAFVVLMTDPPSPELSGAIVKRLHADGSIEAGFAPVILPNSCGDVGRGWRAILTPLSDGGIIVPTQCSFARLRADGSTDEAWNGTRTAFRENGEAVVQVTPESGGRFLVVHGPDSRFPRPHLGRLFADGRLDVESFNPPNRFVVRRVPTISADGLTPGQWYALEVSEILASPRPDEVTWDRLSRFQAPPPNHQPITIPWPRNEFFSPFQAFWRLRESSTP